MTNFHTQPFPNPGRGIVVWVASSATGVAMNTLFKIFILIAVCSFGVGPVNATGDALHDAYANGSRLVVFEGFYNPA
jgi:hypothetical protein